MSVDYYPPIDDSRLLSQKKFQKWKVETDTFSKHQKNPKTVQYRRSYKTLNFSIRKTVFRIILGQVMISFFKVHPRRPAHKLAGPDLSIFLLVSVHKPSRTFLYVFCNFFVWFFDNKIGSSSMIITIQASEVDQTPKSVRCYLILALGASGSRISTSSSKIIDF